MMVFSESNNLSVISFDDSSSKPDLNSSTKSRGLFSNNALAIFIFFNSPPEILSPFSETT